jgi:hypothetical protein
MAEPGLEPELAHSFEADRPIMPPAPLGPPLVLVDFAPSDGRFSSLAPLASLVDSADHWLVHVPDGEPDPAGHGPLAGLSIGVAPLVIGMVLLAAGGYVVGLPQLLWAVPAAVVVAIVPGWAVLSWAGLHHTRSGPALTVAVSMAVWVVGAVVLLMAHLWHPWVAFVVVGLAGAYALRTQPALALAWPRPSSPPDGGPATDAAGWRWLHLGLLGVAIALWLTSVGRIDPAAMDVAGLLPVAPSSFVLAAVVLGIGMAVAMVGPSPGIRVTWLYVVVLILMLFATPMLLSGVPRYAWTYKHIGVAELLDASGQLHRDLDLYNNWPGFFGFAALVADVTGVSLISLAHWAQVGFALLLAPLVAGVAGALGLRVKDQVAVAFLFTAVNWIGQNYFSPQALAFVLVVALLAVVLQELVRDPTDRGARGLSATIAAILRRRRAVDEPGVGNAPTGRAVVLVGLLFAAITVTRQLSPVMALVFVGVLGIGGRLRRPVILVVFAVIAVGWTWTAVGFLSAHSELLSFSSDVSGNATRAVSLTQAPLPSRQVSQIAEVFGLGVWALGGASVIICLVRRTVPVTNLILAFAPFALVFAQSYGGEASYRLYLFTLPGMVCLAYRVIGTGRQGARVRPHPAGLLSFAAALWAVAFAGATVMALATNFGREQVNLVRPEEVRAVAWLMDRAPAGSMIMTLTGNVPLNGSADYAAYVTPEKEAWVNVVQWPQFDYGATDPDAWDDLAWQQRATTSAPEIYLFIGPTDVAGLLTFGYVGEDAAGTLLDRLRASDSWDLVHEDGDARIYRSLIGAA